MEKCASLYTHLNSHREYSHLDNPKEIIDSDHCKEENGEIYKDHLFKNLCYKFATNFTYLIINWGRHENNDKCKYLNLWVYDKLIHNFNINQEDISQSDIIKDINKLWNNYSELFPACSFKNYKISVSEFNNMKYLYDYSQNYDTLKHRSDTTDIDCKKYYCSYIKKNIEVYTTVKDECSSHKDTELCKIFKLIKDDKKPDALFTEFACSSEHVDNNLIEAEKSSNKGLEGSLIFQERYLSTSSSTDLAVKSIFSILGISYSPFGNWFRKKILRINRIWNTIYPEEKKELFDNNLEIEDPNFEKGISIKFHPMINS
ncbi:PIR Superfamily Protein [Plasmodium ovale curtisi]|uniref:PIR Superfamily Protein n=1 Tax=Plasmodium ovale curtisi TaxID=864141 RepID=A0A1A8WSW5_PLAOA|nr:PIR Superfamily Protein [Plasmodium ovale curtisi]SBT01876.1 PIR Superfamily Protein [Plasmodium ovale curtisi]